MKNSKPTILLSFRVSSKLGRWKTSVLGCLISWPKKKKKIVALKCHLLLFFTTTMNHFSIKLWPATKSEFYMTTGNNQLSGWTKEKLHSTSQSQTCTMVTVCWSVSALIHYSFLNPSEITTSEKYAQQVNEVKWNEMKLLSSARLCDPKDYSLPGSSVHGIL